MWLGSKLPKLEWLGVQTSETRMLVIANFIRLLLFLLIYIIHFPLILLSLFFLVFFFLIFLIFFYAILFLLI